MMKLDMGCRLFQGVLRELEMESLGSQVVLRELEKTMATEL